MDQVSKYSKNQKITLSEAIAVSSFVNFDKVCTRYPQIVAVCSQLLYIFQRNLHFLLESHP